MELIICNGNFYGQNIYFYFDKETRKGVIIDPGDSYEEIKKIIAENNLKIIAVLLTHGHFDHTFSANKVRELTNAPVYAHKDEAELLKNPELNRSAVRSLEVSVVPDTFFSDGDIFKFANTELKVIHTPGHTAGGVCYYDEKNEIVFTGDTLFRETVGRTDLPTSEPAALPKSIRDKLFTLPDNVKIFPGHEEGSSIGHEKKNNKRI